MLGGLQLVVAEEQNILTAPISVPPEIHAVLFVPELRIATSDARDVLPQGASRARCGLQYEPGRAAGWPAWRRITRSTCWKPPGDRLHQPYRQALFPAMKLLFQAARDAGALGVFLSGSGSTVLALTQGREMTVGYEMAEAAKQAGVEGQLKVTRPAFQGRASCRRPVRRGRLEAPAARFEPCLL